ncbi:unnamed protein product, partial [Prorocentrum cordatum]
PPGYGQQLRRPQRAQRGGGLDARAVGGALGPRGLVARGLAAGRRAADAGARATSGRRARAEPQRPVVCSARPLGPAGRWRQFAACVQEQEPAGRGLELAGCWPGPRLGQPRLPRFRRLGRGVAGQAGAAVEGPRRGGVFGQRGAEHRGALALELVGQHGA